MNALIGFLIYALIVYLVLYLVFWVIGLFIPVPPQVRNIVFAIVGLILLLEVLQVFLGGGAWHLPYLVR